MNILIISYEPWCDTNNGGNVLSGIFDSFSGADFAQIYCSPGFPDNSVCNKYFQLTDTMLIKKRGKAFVTDNAEKGSAPQDTEWLKERTSNTLFREFFLLGREFLWKLFPWKTKELEEFITGFSPDIIFAPCYSFAHMSYIALYAQQLTGKPIVSYISDDNYSLRKISFSPSFWINKLITRKAIRSLMSKCELIYTMTSAQKREYEAIFNKPFRILCKSADFNEVHPNELHDPIRFIYGGALYLKRWKPLGEIGLALDEINREKPVAVLDIYTGTKLSKRMIKALGKSRGVRVNPAVSYDRLVDEYKASDIAVHVESFDKKNFLMTRLSFSTKIIDCMKSGCAVLAIGPKGQAGIDYLEENNAAVCVRGKEDISKAVKRLTSNTALIREYAGRAIELGKKSHGKAENTRMIKNDFENITKGQIQIK